jgi:hypothetical protein
MDLAAKTPPNSKLEYQKRLDFFMCTRLDTLSVSFKIFEAV